MAHRTSFNYVYRNANSALHRACLNCHVELVSNLIENGANVNSFNPVGQTPLNIACSINKYRRTELVSLLIKYGGDVNAKDEQGFSPLHIAVQNNFPDTLEQLLQAGAEPNSKANEGYSLLHVAAKNNASEIVSILIRSGIYVDVVDKRLNTPLHYASRFGCLASASALLQLGANMLALNDTKTSPLDLVDLSRNTALIKVFRKFAPASKKKTKRKLNIKRRKSSNIDIQLKYPEEDGVAVIKSEPFDEVDTKTKSIRENVNNFKIKVPPNLNPGRMLLKSTSNYDFDGVKKSLEDGGNINYKGRRGMTALLIACYQRRATDLTSFLIKNGADVNVVSQDGRTPLWVAAYRNNLEVALLLIEHGAVINHFFTKRGQTPLHIACKLAHVKMVSLLLTSGAYVHYTDELGQTPIHNAVLRGNKIRARVAIVSLLLKQGCDVNKVNHCGLTALDMAWNKGLKKIVNYLEDVGGKYGKDNDKIGKFPSSATLADTKFQDIKPVIFENSNVLMKTETNDSNSSNADMKRDSLEAEVAMAANQTENMTKKNSNIVSNTDSKIKAENILATESADMEIRNATINTEFVDENISNAAVRSEVTCNAPKRPHYEEVESKTQSVSVTERVSPIKKRKYCIPSSNSIIKIEPTISNLPQLKVQRDKLKTRLFEAQEIIEKLERRMKNIKKLKDSRDQNARHVTKWEKKLKELDVELYHYRMSKNKHEIEITLLDQKILDLQC